MLIRQAEYYYAVASDLETIQALLELVVWCASGEGSRRYYSE